MVSFRAGLTREDAPAGRYELLDDTWDELVNDWPWKDKFPRYARHVKGDVLDLDEDHAFRLMRGGSVAPEGQRQEAMARRALAQARQVLAGLPESVREKLSEDDLEAVATLTREGRPGVVGQAVNVGHPQYANAVYGEREVVDSQTSGGAVAPGEGTGEAGHEPDEPGAERPPDGDEQDQPPDSPAQPSADPGGAGEDQPSARRGRRLP